MKIGQRIREIRTQRSMKTAVFAKLIGISQGSLSDIENGKTNPRASTLQNLVTVLDVDPLWLLLGEGRETIENRLSIKSPIARELARMADDLPLDTQQELLRMVEKEKLLHTLLEKNT